MSEEVKITLELNGEEAALVMASLQTTKMMLDQSMDRAIKDGILPVVQIAKEEINKIDSIVRSCTTTRHYSSDSFVVDHDAMERKMRHNIAAIKQLEAKMKGKDTVPSPEKGKDWDKAGDNVVNILDKFKKDKPDE